MSAEYEDVLDASPLSQGDLFEWIPPEAIRPWRTYGVIVTADCDLEHGKTNGHLSYVPCLLAEDYLWYFWKEKKLAPARESALGTLAARTTKVLKSSNSAQKMLTSAAMLYMVKKHGKELPKIIGITDAGQIKDYSRELDRTLRFAALDELATPDIDALLVAYEGVSKKVELDNEKSLIRDFQTGIGSLPGDVFHLTSTRGDQDGGLFLMLRYISQCDLGDVTFNPAELRYGTAKAKRIGRVAAPFRYAITQNLARVFSDIGLPSEYETRRLSSSESYFKVRGQK